MCETFFEHKLTSEKPFIASHLCYNSLIRIDNKPLFSQRLVPLGYKIQSLGDESSNFCH